MKSRIGLMVLAFGLSVLNVCAQNVLFFGSKQGLSNSRVRSLYEDKRHNIWLSTQNGLNRYDGVKWNVYRHVIGDPTSLMHDEATCVTDYEQGKLLVGTGSGVQLFDYATDRFTVVPMVTSRGDTLTTRVVNFCRIHPNRMMVCFAGYGHGEVVRDKEGKLYVKQSADLLTGEQQWNPVQLLEDKQNRLWVVNSGGGVLRKTGDGKFHAYEELKGVRKLAFSSSGQMYAATVRSGIYVYDSQTDHFRQVATAEEMGGVVSGFNSWWNGRMFIGTDGGGLRIYDEKTGLVTRSTISVKDFDFKSANVNDAIRDAYGNVWVAIYMKGVMMKPMNQSSFEYVGRNSMTKNSIGDNAVFSLAKAVGSTTYPDGLWVTTDNDGLYLMASDGSSSHHWSSTNTPGMPKNFTTVLNTAPSTMLLGTFTDGLWKMQNGRFSQLTTDITHIFDIVPATEPDYCWIATMGEGIYYYHLPTGKWLNHRPDHRKEGGTRIMNNGYVYAVLQVDDMLLVGTADGLSVCFPEADGTIPLDCRKLLGRHTVRCFAVTKDKRTAWIATNMGLVKLNCMTFEQRTYTTEDGLPNNNIASLCLDGENLWVGTDYGLSCMDVEKETFTNFFSGDGLQANEFSRGAALLQDGKIYFGGIDGITYFDVKGMKDWQSRAKGYRVRFVDVYVGERKVHAGEELDGYEVLTGLVDDCAQMDLSHENGHFTLEMCVEGLNSQFVVYEFSVNGAKWQRQSISDSRLVFDNLKPGTYHIRVRAHVMGAVSEERELVAVVHPAWYASAWAKVIYFLLFLLVAWLVYEYVKRQVHLRRVIERTRQQRELNDARVQFFMNISHEIRTPMTLILAPLEKLMSSDKNEERQHNYKLMKQNSKRILRLINQMMDVRKIEQGKFLLDYHAVELVGFLQNIFDVFVTNAQSRNINYEFLHDVDSLPVYVDPDNMDKIVMNLLSNAFKFTPDGGKITMQLKTEGENFELVVADSGVGIQAEDKTKVFDRFYSGQHQNGYIGTGIGLNLTSMLVKLHKGSITVEDNPEGKGTLFTVTMPMGDETLRNIKPDKLEMVTEVDGMTTIEEDTAELLTIDKPNDTHRRNALLVEDDEAIRQYVHSELSKDLVIHSCANGQEAWDYIVAHPGKVDVVISDIMMPVMDGMTLCQKLKANFTTNHIPIVLMTALGSDADRIAGITNGADAYVSKPFNIDVLRTTVLQLMKTRQMLQGKYHGDKQQEENIDKVEMESPDEHLMRRVMKVINENMDNPELSVELIADKVGISRVHFYRKMKDLTGQAPRDFVKYVRLKEAARLLSEKHYDITGVSIATGFKSLSAFSTNFKSLYGLSPTEWVKQQEGK
ncbi:MAG: response regulator [Bacteroidaceae bacterium]|nr:response regulator [Bacteroidaceae bacterium]